MNYFKHLTCSISFIFCFLVLASCGDEITVTLSGSSVSDGPVVDSSVSIATSSGVVLETGQTDEQGNYAITLTVSRYDYPLLIESTGGTDLVTQSTPEFSLKSLVVTHLDKHANLNPHTTLITKSAEYMPGGLTQSNIRSAKKIVLQRLNFGFDSALFTDPFTTQLNETNVATLLKSGEAMVETLRRTRDARQAKEANISSDDIVMAWAADLTDGVIDGKGAVNSDPRIAAVSTIVSGQVVLESLQNQLQVLGVDSTSKTDEIIQLLFPEKLDSVAVRSTIPTVSELEQLKIALAAVLAIENNEIVDLMLTSLTNSEDNPPLQNRVDSLPVNAGENLDRAISLAADADDEQLELINKIVRDGRLVPAKNNLAPVISAGTTPQAEQPTARLPNQTPEQTGQVISPQTEQPAARPPNQTPEQTDQDTTPQIELPILTNNKPTISGIPSTTVIEDTNYHFVPQAQDDDADTLLFTIGNKPGWATFDPATGSLVGKPGSEDAAIYANIVINVTDGSETASLPSFDITVINANLAPIISGTPATTVIEGELYRFIPQASDADGDSLKFKIKNAPNWITFDSSTGTVKGTPKNNDIGLYKNVTITVRDNNFTTVLRPFSIEVLVAKRTFPQALPSAAKLWSDPDTWGGTVPKAGADIEIKAGTEVLLDENTANLANLKISGKLIFDQQDLQLTAESILVADQGELWIGSEMEPFNNKALITLTGNDRNKQSPIHPGTKALVVMGGQLHLHGRKKLSWTRLAANADISATEIKLEKAPNWQVGDRIAIASTDFDFRQAEQRVITAIAGTKVSFDEPLEFLHWGEMQNFGSATIDERAEVGLLTRNITIQGDESSDASRFGGHVMIHGNEGIAQVSGVAFYRMGQEGLLARYPYHWHLAEDRSGDYFNGNSIYNSYQRCVTVHGTHNVEVKDNVAYDITSHCYFLEDGIETGNVFEENLGMVVRRPKKEVALLPSDFAGHGASVFWISNPDNTFRNNVAAGSEGSGFWIALAKHPSGPSATDSVWPRYTPLKEFSGNVSHSNGANGLHVDHGPRDNPQAGQEVVYYRPKSEPAAVDPLGKNTSAPVTAIFDKFTAYKNRNRGVWLRGENHVLRDAKLADNAIGATFASDESFAINSVFIGETANLGTPTAYQLRQNRVGENNRSLPKPYLINFTIRGFEFYDGKVGVENSYFDQFESTEQRQAGALSVLDFTDFHFSPKNYAKNLSWATATNRVYLATRAVPANEAPGEDGYRSATIFDEDGSTTGTAGQYIVVDNPFLIKENACNFVVSWNTYKCSLQYVHLQFLNRDASPANIAPVKISSENGTSHTMLGIHQSRGVNIQFTTNINPADRYRYSFSSSLPNHSRLQLKKGAGDADAASVSLPFSRASAYVYRSGVSARKQLQPAKSLDELDSSSGELYYLSGSRLYLKLQIPSERDYTALDICKSELCR